MVARPNKFCKAVGGAPSSTRVSRSYRRRTPLQQPSSKAGHPPHLPGLILCVALRISSFWIVTDTLLEIAMSTMASGVAATRQFTNWQNWNCLWVFGLVWRFCFQSHLKRDRCRGNSHGLLREFVNSIMSCHNMWLLTKHKGDWVHLANSITRHSCCGVRGCYD